jgi:4'-phosphopantetheinyl transferase EntD
MVRHRPCGPAADKLQRHTRRCGDAAAASRQSGRDVTVARQLQPQIALSGAEPRRSILLQSLLPPGVSATELRLAPVREACEPEQIALPGRSQLQFAREIAASRLCMLRAVEKLEAGWLPEARKQPPPLTGSITVAEGFCGAAVGEKDRFLAIGINAQACRQVTHASWADFVSAAERSWLNGMAPSRRSAAAALLLAAKEAFHQCYHVLTSEWLESSAVSIRFSGGIDRRGEFSVDAGQGMSGVGEPSWGPGRFCFRRGMVVAAIAVPAIEAA